MKTSKNTNRVRLDNGSFLNPFVEHLLSSRGICEHDDIKTFLQPKLKDLPDPFLLKDMGRAVKLIEACITEEFQFLIWGDYDVDGTTATALLLIFFRSIGCNAVYHIPNRLKDGYGIQKRGLENITEGRDPSKTLIITVDNGISAHEAVEYAKESGYRIIVTDHHLPPALKVSADAVINPSQPSCLFPDKTLAGVGVAFYLAMATRSHLVKVGFFKTTTSIPNLKQLLDLVAIGTVADMVPLKSTNRILVKAGMEVLAKKGNIGLTALCRKNNLDISCIRSEDISFQLAPKINAAGRLGEAEKAVELFLSTKKSEAVLLAKQLVKNNEIRRTINIDDFVKAKNELNGEYKDGNYAVVVAGDYHVGVAGIVASNLVEKYQKPSVVLCSNGNGILKGSARSVQGIDLYLALENCKEAMIGFGGHKMAGGMSLTTDNLELFRELFEEAIKEQAISNTFEITELVDADIPIKELFTMDILRQLHLMEPFGQANPQPIFRDRVSGFLELKPLGKDKKHLRCSFSGNRNSIIKGVAFGMGELLSKCKNIKKQEVLYTPTLNFFRGRRSWQVRVVSIPINT